MSRGDFDFAFLLIGGPALVSWGLVAFRKKRLVENTPTSKVRSAAMGLVELSGVARARVELNDPISRQPSCWWRCLIQEYRPSGKHSRWVTIKELTSYELLYLEDETGKLLIDPVGADFHGDVETVALNSSTRISLEPVLAAWGIDSTGWFGGLKSLRIQKWAIAPGQALYVLGELGRRDESARDAAIPNCDRFVVQKSADQPLSIATKSEKEILKSLMLQSAGGILGGMALSGLGAWWAVYQGFSIPIAAAMVGIGIIIGLVVGNLGMKIFKGGLSWHWSS